MNIETASITLSVGAISGLLIVVFSVSRQLGALELKVNTMWDFQMRRAFSEVVTAGLAKKQSPLIFKDGLMEKLDPIKPELAAWWKASGYRYSDSAALMEIERLFGNQLFTLVCVPCCLSHGACLLLAITVAKQVNEVVLTT